MKKAYYFVLAPLLAGISCFIAYSLIGSEVKPDGTLEEPFALIPIGYLFFVVAIVALIFIGIKRLFKK